MTWSLPVLPLPGLMVRIHVVFLAFIAVRAVQSIQTQQAGIVFQAAGLLGLVLLVCLHEVAHALAARRIGMKHDRLVLWPLGGLDHGEQPRTAGGAAAVAVAGPAVNLALLVPLAALTYLTAGSWDLVIFDPFASRDAARSASAEGLAAWFVWTLHANNAMLLAFNLLVPMYPLDSGRMVHALVWRWRGESSAARASGGIGVFVACLLAAIGLVANESVLLSIAVVGVFVCWQEIARTRFLEVSEDDGVPRTDPIEVEPPDLTPDADAIDQILKKISRSGIASLTENERRLLDQASAAGHDN
ncbi:MAG: site-2 protease family protein [Planctomycetota bacterium]